MKIIFHGAAREVGRSCFEIKTNGDRYFLDAGIKFKENGFDYPQALFNIGSFDGLFISHAHLDHSGALPMLEHNNIICPIFCTKLTYELTKVLLKDSYKIARIRHLDPAYEKVDLKKVDKSVRFVKYKKEYKHREVKFKYYNAGHIPGSSMIELQFEGKKLLYTGDFKVATTELMKGCEQDFNDIDILISESTYGNRGLPDRTDLNKRFIERVEDVVKKGGSVLIPVFALGRAQEILILLTEKKLSVPIYYDGMCNQMNKKILSTEDEYVNKRAELNDATFSKAMHISSEKRRQVALSKPGIFVTTSGMLQGGPVMNYLKEMWGNPLNAVFLTGYQCKRTNGRHLIEEGFVYLDGWKTQVKCQVEKFDFSGHADQESLKAFVKKVNPKHIIFVHGDNGEIDEMKRWSLENTSAKVYDPKVGDELEF